MSFARSFGGFLLLALSLGDAKEVTVREALLCEASYRLGSIYSDKSLLQSEKTKDGVTLRITKKSTPCGGNKIPMTFGEFDAEGVTPLDIFNVLADTAHQQEWDSLVGSETELGEFPEQQAKGVAMSFVAHPFSDRQVFEWEVFNASRDLQDLWVVFSTEDNAMLHAKTERQSGAVHAQDCLAAYHVLAKPGGGVHVVFTSDVNAHPFLLSSEFIFNLMWTKTVDYIDALRTRAQKVAKLRSKGQVPHPVVKDSLLYDPDTKGFTCKISGGLADLTMSFDAKARPVEGQPLWRSRVLLPLIVLLPGLAAMLSLGAVIRRRRAREVVASPGEPLEPLRQVEKEDLEGQGLLRK